MGALVSKPVLTPEQIAEAVAARMQGWPLCPRAWINYANDPANYKFAIDEKYIGLLFAGPDDPGSASRKQSWTQFAYYCIWKKYGSLE